MISPVFNYSAEELLSGYQLSARSTEMDLFLEPPHEHDPYIFLSSANPRARSPQHDGSPLPLEFNRAIQAGSFVFASTTRLQHLLLEFSEFSSLEPTQQLQALLFNASGRLQAEKRYLVEEAWPEWSHRSRLVRRQLTEPDKSVPGGLPKSLLDLQKWWQVLENFVNYQTEVSQEIGS